MTAMQKTAEGAVLKIAFDRIAQSYDRQRAHPPEVSTQVGAAVSGIVGPAAQVLELGIGTGRIGLPVAAAGCRVVGIDIAREMLAMAAGRARELQQPLNLIQGNILQLPLRDQSFDAVLAVHVLHLVPDWRATLAEARRVLREGGKLIQGRDWREPHSCAERLRARLREVVMELLPGSRPPGAGAAIGQALARMGGTLQPELIAAEWQEQLSPAAVLEGMAAREDAETWVLDNQTLAAALERLQDWALQTWPDLDAEQVLTRRFVLSVVSF